MNRGILFVVSAPSGAGKTSLVKKLREQLQGFSVSVSHTTRPRRTGETDGVDYFFTALPQFTQMVNAGAFLEHAQVFDHCYGTARATVEGILDTGSDVLLEIDWQGARQIKQQMPSCQTIFILPPSREALLHRLQSRGQDDGDTIARRMGEAIAEMSHYNEYDYLVINDDFDQALADLASIVNASRLRTAVSFFRRQALIASLLA